MNVISSALQAIGLFLVTSIDDIIVLSPVLRTPSRTTRYHREDSRRQYLGFGGILLASLAVTFGRRALPSRRPHPLLRSHPTAPGCLRLLAGVA